MVADVLFSLGVLAGAGSAAVVVAWAAFELAAWGAP